MKIKAHFLGGPSDGQVEEWEEVDSLVHGGVVYTRRLTTKPQGPEMAIAYFAPDTWDRSEFLKALGRSLPGTQR